MAFYRQRRARDRVYHLNMISYGVLSVFLGAFGWYWWDSQGFQQPVSKEPFVLMGLSAMAYMVVRGFLLVARWRQRELRRNRATGCV